MKPSRFSGSVAILVSLVFAGCGVPDTEVDGVPGPGALSQPQDRPRPATTPSGSSSTAGINSADRPADAAGGHPGPARVGETKDSPTPETTPQR